MGLIYIILNYCAEFPLRPCLLGLALEDLAWTLEYHRRSYSCATLIFINRRVQFFTIAVTE